MVGGGGGREKRSSLVITKRERTGKLTKDQVEKVARKNKVVKV